MKLGPGRYLTAGPKVGIFFVVSLCPGWAPALPVISDHHWVAEAHSKKAANLKTSINLQRYCQPHHRFLACETVYFWVFVTRFGRSAKPLLSKEGGAGRQSRAENPNTQK